MRTTVKKWGNSAAVRIPVTVLQGAQLNLEDAVEVRGEDGRIVIEPVRPRGYDLAQLLAGITRRNLHDEVDFGGAVGKEAW
ncbi:MAG: AbrB/MazE/SpoVT family DNA-binding domain-containing protein [Rhodanobacteraceae bacterium]|nr:MAG: AbrB/MazE/SpoVT family DNA-binding domain-containing protein [Rhodanobacteraceae bacterium]